MYRPKDDFITRPQAADYLNISLSTVDRLLHQKAIPHIRLKGRVYFLKQRLDAWLMSLEQLPDSRNKSKTVRVGKRRRGKAVSKRYI